jgi:uncharacterized protein with HEPN domain
MSRKTSYVSRDWTFYLGDILEACDLISTFTQDYGYHEFRSTPLVFHAVVRNLEIIGEAVKRIPRHVMDQKPEIDWSGAAKFRDVIAHQYFGLDPLIIWDVVQNRVPEMRAAAEELLSARPMGEEGGTDL